MISKAVFQRQLKLEIEGLVLPSRAFIKYRMSNHHPECPLYNHENCKELRNQKVCAIVRKDKTCLTQFPKTRKKAQD